ncbi:DUF1768-domain-containing protein [Ophiobolus disseminans]|uniref:DUF1768-domain-containing protein n=1 Tax=Ophiobolus disseminans TaxID=1469910 RepID=A0A6A7A6Z1_9PLEO|nr:DUF1768-domain-containing protein [Ophiobolus disseminans]
MPFKTTPDPAFPSKPNPKPKQHTPSSSSSSKPDPSTGPVFFWHPHDGHGYLGQWYHSPFSVDGDTYATAEMYMMVQKARLFRDEDVARKMLNTTDPKRHKALGRQVKGFEGGVWDEHKLSIVEQANYHKFTISEDEADLRKMLLATAERELVEASPLDRVWGVGFAEKNAEANRARWGQNLLGKALMNVRGRLRAEVRKGYFEE